MAAQIVGDPSPGYAADPGADLLDDDHEGRLNNMVQARP